MSWQIASAEQPARVRMIAQETDTEQPEDPTGTVGAYLALLGLGQELSCQPAVAGVSVPTVK